MEEKIRKGARKGKSIFDLTGRGRHPGHFELPRNYSQLISLRPTREKAPLPAAPLERDEAVAFVPLLSQLMLPLLPRRESKDAESVRHLFAIVARPNPFASPLGVSFCRCIRHVFSLLFFNIALTHTAGAASVDSFRFLRFFLSFFRTND